MDKSRTITHLKLDSAYASDKITVPIIHFR